MENEIKTKKFCPVCLEEKQGTIEIENINKKLYFYEFTCDTCKNTFNSGEVKKAENDFFN